MPKPIRGRITFANVVAVIALFVALGGTTYAAAKLSGKQIKPKSIPANRIKPNSLSSKQIKDQTLNAVKSAAALGRVTYATGIGTLDPANFSAQTFTANCPAPLNAVGGGVTFGNPDEGFFSDGNITPTRTGYAVRAYTGGGAPTTVTVTAVCLSASSITG